MGKTLMGGIESGTPTETRGGARAMGDVYGQILGGGNYDQVVSRLGSPFQRGTATAMANTLGFDPSMLNLGGAINDVLVDPASATAGLFASLAPFEAAETGRQVAGTREMFGTMGGRFGRNVAGAEALTRGEVANQFMRTRQQGLLEAQGRRIQALGTVMPAMAQARHLAFQEQMAPYQMMLQFLQPGSPAYREGLLPGLIGAGGQIASAALLSDRRLKENVQYISDAVTISRPDGTTYTIQPARWDWNRLAEQTMGLSGSSTGVIAQDLQTQRPDLVVYDGGFLKVDYGTLVAEMAQTLAERG